jgi:arylsulfatase A-like enzyme/Flp pilus assembly protein TadD
MTEVPESHARGGAGRQRRAWWQWVLGVGLIVFAVYSLVIRWIESEHPDWLMLMNAAESTPLRIPEGVKSVERVPGAHGEYSDYNLMIITLDTTRADRLGYYGYDKIQTPALDRLATGGVYFTQAFAPNPTTLPSHGGIMSGLFPFHHGGRKNGTTVINEGVTTLAEILRDQGYATCGVVSAEVLNSRYGIAQGFDTYIDEVEEFHEALVHRVPERRGGDTTDLALEWLRAHGGRKFFQWVHYYDAHSPYMPLEPFATQYKDRLYEGEIAYVDTQIGRLVAHLEESGLIHRTLIVVVGDHAEMLGQHGEWTHSLLIYDPVLHVPFLMYCDGKLGGGAYVDKVVTSVDVTPTVLSLLGVSNEHKMDGVDLTQPWDESRSIFIDTLEGFSQYGISPLLGVRDDQYKYIYCPQPELYELKDDPEEEGDLAGDRPADAEEMLVKLKGFFGDDLRAAGFAETSGTLDEDDRNALAALGYISAGLGDAQAPASLPNPRDAISIINQIQYALRIEKPEDRDLAVEKLERIAEKHPEFYATHRYLADQYFRIGQYFLAKGALIRCLEIYPDTASNVLMLAQTYARLGETDEAVETYKKAVELSVNKYAPLAQLGELYALNGRWVDAAEHLLAAAAVRPDEPGIIGNLIRSVRASDSFASAIPKLQELLRSHPEFGHLRTALATLLMDRGRQPEAKALFRVGIREYPDDHDLKIDFAARLLEQDAPSPADVLAAVDLAEAACLADGRTNPRFLHTLCLAYVEAGRRDEARSSDATALIETINRTLADLGPPESAP